MQQRYLAEGDFDLRTLQFKAQLRGVTYRGVLVARSFPNPPPAQALCMAVAVPGSDVACWEAAGPLHHPDCGTSTLPEGWGSPVRITGQQQVAFPAAVYIFRQCWLSNACSCGRRYQRMHVGRVYFESRDAAAFRCDRGWQRNCLAAFPSGGPEQAGAQLAVRFIYFFYYYYFFPGPGFLVILTVGQHSGKPELLTQAGCDAGCRQH